MTGGVNGLTIDYLADRAEFLPVLAKWFYDQWGRHREDRTPETYVRLLRENLNRERIPVTFVALAGNTPVGAASVLEDDLPLRSDLTPWLATVYVRPDRRLAGIGSALVGRAVREAELTGATEMYLYTSPELEHFYTRLGWSVEQEAFQRGKKIIVMRYDF